MEVVCTRAHGDTRLEATPRAYWILAALSASPATSGRLRPVTVLPVSTRRPA